MMRDRFDAVVSSVDVVAHEKVICVGRLAADAEKLHEVVELAMDISTHRDRTVDSLLEKHKFIQCCVPS